MTRRVLSSVFLLALGILPVACSDEPLTSLSSTPETSIAAGSELEVSPRHSIDAFFEEVARTVPGFGGLFFTEGQPAIYLTVVDSLATEAAREVLLPMLAVRGLAGTPLRVLQGQYGWRQLSEWHHRRLLPVLALDGVISTDADESINRIVIGVESQALRPAVLEAVRRLGVPAEAVVIEETTRPVALQSLGDRVRATLGGLRVNDTNGGCTLGFNVDYGGTRTFMTNSHCTASFGAVTNDLFYQATWNVSDHFVGSEFLDPALRNYGTFCPSGRNDCRWSDAALIKYNAGTEWVLGRVARTSFADRWDGSRTIAGRFWISGKETSFAVGDALHKMGATTGWTYGGVDNNGTCVHYDMGTRYLMCQGVVNAGVNFGDSGSPVFLRVAGDEIKLVGILWGGHPVGTSSGARFVFSPIGGIEEDFGAALNVVGNSPVSVYIEGETSVRDPGLYRYEAFPTGGNGSYTYQWEIAYPDIGGGWGSLGTSKTQDLSVAEGDGDIELRVTVTSAGETSQITIHITNSIACGQLISC